MKQSISAEHKQANTAPASSATAGTLTHPIQSRVNESPRQNAQRARLAQLQHAATPGKPNGLPSTLRTGIEALSGMDMGDVAVHRNSAKPAQLNALAYAQGNDIHLGPGQEQHLPHEAWHVVQQRQGRVRPTMQMKGSVLINDDKSLEREADVMGAKAMHAATIQTQTPSLSANAAVASAPVQRQERRAMVDWMVTHLVKGEGGSLFGDDWQSGELDVDQGQLTKGQQIIVDDEDVYMSRRGPNQEDTHRRAEDEKGFKQYKWLRVTSVEGKKMDQAVYIRAETIRIQRDGPRAEAEVIEGTDPALFEGLPDIHGAWLGARDKRRRSIGLKVNNDIDTYNEEHEDDPLSSGWNWDQFDEGVDVSHDMQNKDDRLKRHSLPHWTLRAGYGDSSPPIAYMILEAVPGDERPSLYLRWLIGHPNQSGGGGALMEAAKKILKKGNYTEISVHAAYSAVPWYEHMGFEVVTPGKIIEGVGYGDTELSLKNE